MRVRCWPKRRQRGSGVVGPVRTQQPLGILSAKNSLKYSKMSVFVVDQQSFASMLSPLLLILYPSSSPLSLTRSDL
jgi:hypothetical protein